MSPSPAASEHSTDSVTMSNIAGEGQVCEPPLPSVPISKEPDGPEVDEGSAEAPQLTQDAPGDTPIPPTQQPEPFKKMIKSTSVILMPLSHQDAIE